MNSTIQTSSMHEMLFEKRNKDYGAYVIRSTYNDAVLKSLIMVASALLLFIGGAYAYNNFFAGKTVVEDKAGDQEYISTVVDLNPLDPKMPEAPKTPSAPQAAATPMIIRDSIPQDPNQNNLPLAPVAGNGDGDSTNIGEPLAIGGGGGGGNPEPKVEVIEEPTSIAEVMPKFPGGTKALIDFVTRNVVYPERSKILGMQGTVFVSFVVSKDGKVTNCKVLKGVDDDCNEEALRVVSKMPEWEPGRNGSKAVPVIFNLPIKFKLN